MLSFFFVHNSLTPFFVAPQDFKSYWDWWWWVVPPILHAYKIPGGKLGMWLVAGTGIVVILFAFCMGFVPPEQLQVGTPVLYTGLVAAGLVVFISMPIIIHACKKSSWVKK